MPCSSSWNRSPWYRFSINNYVRGHFLCQQNFKKEKRSEMNLINFDCQLSARSVLEVPGWNLHLSLNHLRLRFSQFSENESESLFAHRNRRRRLKFLFENDHSLTFRYIQNQGIISILNLSIFEIPKLHVFSVRTFRLWKNPTCM